MLRTEALTKMAAGGNKKILVTYPEALFEKVVLPNTLQQNMIQIKTNDVLKVDPLIEQLVSYGFERTDFVYEPGQFAIRGGILDIYSFGNEKPYRIELFGDEVDSIRIFDPETQLSERKLLQVNLIPKFDQPSGDQPLQDFFSFIPSNTIVYASNWELMEDRYSDFFSQIPDDEQDGFTSFDAFSHQLTHFNCIELSHQGVQFYPAPFNFTNLSTIYSLYFVHSIPLA